VFKFEEDEYWAQTSDPEETEEEHSDMGGPQIYSFGYDPITCHAFNKDRTKLAISHNNNEVNLYSFKGGQWDLTDTLTEHVQRITSIDWAPSTNRIVTCGADRNAYVWEEQGGKWKPNLVILRINRAATYVKWSPMENKFAVGSGARLISVCYFEQENDWWLSKHIKKPLRSTVTSLDWHPNNVLLASGSTDFSARVFSAYVKEVDEKPVATPWGKKMTFGNVMAEFVGGGGWVHSVSFSADGNKLAWVGHDATMSVANAVNNNQVSTIKTNYLPLMTCSWVSPYSILAAGHGCCPMIFRYDDSGNVTFVAKLDAEKKAASAKFNAMKHFQSLDARAQTQEENQTSVSTVHQNTISQVSIFAGDKNNAAKFVTSGVDAQLIVWDFKTLEASIAGLRI